MSESQEKPPIGLTPKRIHDSVRVGDIVRAMNRFIDAGMDIPQDWVNELSDISDSYKAKGE